MTKEEASDLKSLILRVIETEKALQNAELSNNQAHRDLEIMLYNLQQRETRKQ
jgi:hypothetical protein